MTSTAAEAAKAPRLYIHLFMELDVGGSEPFRMWSGPGEHAYDGSTYYGIGGILTMSAVESTATPTAREVSISLAREGGDFSELVREAMRHSIADNDFRAFLLMSEVDLKRAGTAVHEIPLLIGKVSSVSAVADRVEMTIYTAMYDATTTRGLAKLWTDDQQRRYVSATDRAFRHVKGSSGEEIAF